MNHKTPYKHRNMRILPLLFSLFFFASCNTSKKGFGADPTADFTQYKTYAFSETTHKGVKSLTKTRILQAIENEMKAKGMVAAAEPDVLIDVVTTQSERNTTSKTTVNNPWHFGAWAGFEGTYTYNNVQKQATVVISLVDAQTQKMVWVGSSTRHLSNDMANSPGTGEVNKTVKGILKHYPPK